MSRGRKPDGQRALTGAERQARHRIRDAVAAAASGPPRRRPHPAVKPADRRSRPQRWRAAVAELIVLQAEYATWLDAVPEATRDSATGAALQAIVDLDLDEIGAIEPPRGFGRD